MCVYDSLPSGGTLSSRVKEQIASICCTPKNKIDVTFVDVQRQIGGSDCGLFALAFATSLCAGNNPGEIIIYSISYENTLSSVSNKDPYLCFLHVQGKDVLDHVRRLALTYTVIVDNQMMAVVKWWNAMNVKNGFINNVKKCQISYGRTRSISGTAKTV